MNEQPLSLSYDLASYNHRAACRRVTQSVIPAHLRYAPLLVISFLALLIFLAVAYGLRVSGGKVYLAFAIAYALFVFAHNLRRKTLWHNVSLASQRSGTTRLALTETGITLDDDASHTTLYWSHIQDVIPATDGMLILTGGMNYFPIPARAFPTPDAQQQMLEELRRRLRAAKGQSDDHA